MYCHIFDNLAPAIGYRSNCNNLLHPADLILDSSINRPTLVIEHGRTCCNLAMPLHWTIAKKLQSLPLAPFSPSPFNPSPLQP